MFTSLFLITLIALGGMALTYLVTDDERFMWRLAAGNIVGSAVFGLVVFVTACFFGFSIGVVLFSVLITLLPFLFLLKTDTRKNFLKDWRRARGKLEGTTNGKLLGLAYYVCIFLLLSFFFDRAMIEAKDGISTGVAHNLGDLHFHLGAIFSFTDGQNFPPENPSFTGVKFTYPFMADLISAALVELGAGVRQAMFWQNLTLGLSLVVVLENFTFKLTASKLAGKIAPLLLLFSGGFGFVLFFRDFLSQQQGLYTFLWNLPIDYTIRFTGGLRWGNSLITLFITQRSLLLGMPLALIVLGYLWKLFTAPADDEPTASISRLYRPLLIGALTGFLPLVHVHSLLVVMAVAGFIALLTLKRWKEWLAFFIGVGLVAGPELLWAMIGSATQVKEFVGWHFGWDKGDWNFFSFWIVNTGLFIPLLFTVIVLLILDIYRGKDGRKPLLSVENSLKLLLFYVPFASFFVICNVLKLAPWEWDNIKVLIYWCVGSIPLVALLLAKVWERGRWLKLAAAGAFAILIFSGALDVWHAISGSQSYRVSDKDAVAVAADIKRLTEPKALFLNAPIYNSPVGLTGRRSLMRYSGHLSSYGIDYQPRENDVRRIYEGGGVADILLKKYNIEYVVIGPDERNDLKANEEFFKKYPVIAEEGPYRVYKINK